MFLFLVKLGALKFWVQGWYILFTTRWHAGVQWAGNVANHLALCWRPEKSREKSPMSLRPICLLWFNQLRYYNPDDAPRNPNQPPRSIGVLWASWWLVWATWRELASERNQPHSPAGKLRPQPPRSRLPPDLLGNFHPVLATRGLDHWHWLQDVVNWTEFRSCLQE